MLWYFFLSLNCLHLISLTLFDIFIWVRGLFIFLRADFMLLGHSCGCRCLSGTFVMVFCAARTQPGTNRGDPPLPATNRWMSEGGRLGNRISLPQFRRGGKNKTRSPTRFLPAAAQIGTEGEHLLGNGDFLCWSMCLSSARSRDDAPRQKRSAERLCTSASSGLQCCCSLLLLWNKRAHSSALLFCFC